MSDFEANRAGMTRRNLIAGSALLALPLLTGACSGAEGADLSDLPIPDGSLRQRAERKGLLIGAQLDPPEAQDKRTRAAMSDYNVLVPGNGFNWTRVQPEQNGPLHFEQARPIIDLARSTGALIRLHNLHYDKTTPAWVKAAVAAATPAQAGKLLENHIREVLKPWGAAVAHINVVNEPEYGIGRPFRPDTFGDKIGEEYFDIAFHTARECAPQAVLFTNIAVVEQVGRRYDNARRGALGLHDRLLRRGVPIDAVGIEGHLDSVYAFDATLYAGFLTELASRDLGILITEFDVIDTAFPADPVRRDIESAHLLEDFLTTSFANPKCMGACTWSPANKFAWLVTDRTLARPDGAPRRPGLLDTNYRRTRLWGAVARALDRAAPRSMAVRAGARSRQTP